MSPLYDIVIPVGPNDLDLIIKVVYCVKQNVQGYRNIYIIPYDPNIYIDGCITVPEHVFPFNIHTLGELIDFSERTPWYFQQLLKLYAGFYVPDILPYYLVIDSDTFFINPTTFFEDETPLYNIGKFNYSPYYEHMIRLHPSLIKYNEYSGVSHHMIFHRDLVRQLFDIVEEYTGDIFWRSFMKCLDPEHINSSGASEYEIYFNYLLNHHNDKMKIRQLNWEDVYQLFYHPDLNYISWHHYKR